jgi:hypothetical protein
MSGPLVTTVERIRRKTLVCPRNLRFAQVRVVLAGDELPLGLLALPLQHLLQGLSTMDPWPRTLTTARWQGNLR